MTHLSTVAVLIAAASYAVPSLSAQAASLPDGDTEEASGWGSYTDDSGIAVGADVGRIIDGSDAREAVTVSTGPRDRYERRALCVEWFEPGAAITYRSQIQGDEAMVCDEQVEPEEGLCLDGQEPLLPLWRSPVIDSEGPIYGPWAQLTGFECPEDPLTAAVAEEWRQMTITPQPLDVLPNDGWARASWGVKADLDDAPQTSTVSVLGTDVVLRATPTGQEWTVTDVMTGQSWPGCLRWGDLGEEVITFERKEHRVSLGLTTTWEGHYSLDGALTWMLAPGTATTTSEPRSVHVYNPRARLVNCDTFGDCIGSGDSSNPFTLTDPDADGIDNYQIPDNEIADYLETRAK